MLPLSASFWTSHCPLSSRRYYSRVICKTRGPPQDLITRLDIYHQSHRYQQPLISPSLSFKPVLVSLLYSPADELIIRRGYIWIYRALLRILSALMASLNGVSASFQCFLKSTKFISPHIPYGLIQIQGSIQPFFF